jgi:hypothetical protein
MVERGIIVLIITDVLITGVLNAYCIYNARNYTAMWIHWMEHITVTN